MNDKKYPVNEPHRASHLRYIIGFYDCRNMLIQYRHNLTGHNCDDHKIKIFTHFSQNNWLFQRVTNDRSFGYFLVKIVPILKRVRLDTPACSSACSAQRVDSAVIDSMHRCNRDVLDQSERAAELTSLWMNSDWKTRCSPARMTV